MVIVDPSHGTEPNGKASIREVYAIVLDLEDKIVTQLKESERRITTAVEDIRKLRAADMERVTSLEEWRRSVEESKRVSLAVKDGRMWMFKEFGNQVEEHWKFISVLLILLTVVFDFFINHVIIQP
jgi:hypothetical protein